MSRYFVFWGKFRLKFGLGSGQTVEPSQAVYRKLPFFRQAQHKLKRHG